MTETIAGPVDIQQSAAVARRRRWMAVLARSSAADLDAVLAGLDHVPAYTFLRTPEVGAIMLRGRAGGSGQRFNLGEATVTRCTIRFDDGTAGTSYALGRDTRRAEAAAVLDALLQKPGGEALFEAEIAPLEARQAAVREAASRKAASTKVDFFTLVRGEG